MYDIHKYFTQKFQIIFYQNMSKIKKPLQPLNRLFALLVKQKASQVAVANTLGISSQSVGYYMRGRKIPIEVIEKWEEKYGQNLIAMSKTEFETQNETPVSRETNNSVAMEVIRGFEKLDPNIGYKVLGNENYIVFHKKTYDEMEETLAQNRSVIDMLSRASFELTLSNKKLADSVEEAIKLAKASNKKKI